MAKANVSLAQALKLKSREARKIQRLKQLINEHNSRLVGNETQFDVRALLSELETRIDRLIDMKVAIDEGNAPIREKIYRLAELRGMAAFYQTLNTQDGTPKAAWMEHPQVFVAEIKAKESLEKVQAIESEIEAVQDELDQFNSSQSVIVEVDSVD